MKRSKTTIAILSLTLLAQLAIAGVVSGVTNEMASQLQQNQIVPPQPDKSAQQESKADAEQPVEQVVMSPVAGNDTLIPDNADLKSYQNSPQVVTDESYAPIEVSLKDISRLVCFRNIDRVIYSKEKGVEIKTIDRNAFIKNLPREIQEPTGKIKIEYDMRPKELYMVCGSKTFSLLLIPKDIPATTVYLKSSFSEKDKALEHEKASTHEETILSLIKDAYFETVPIGYEVHAVNKPLLEFQEIRITHIRDYVGTLYIIQELLITAKMPITLDNTVVLEAVMPVSPLAISIVSPNLRPTEQTRAFIVRMQRDE